MKYIDALNYAENRGGGTKGDLLLMEEVLSFLEIQKLPKMIRIIGTNGKGTTGSMISSLMTSVGLNTTHLTSPHVVDYRERIFHKGELISKQDFTKIVKKVKFIEESFENKISYFSFALLIGLIYSYKEGVDYIILESGIGGKRDVTHSLEPIIGTVFTKISLDHENLLGDSIEKIAREKGEGLKGFGLLISQEKVVEDIISETAKEKGLPLKIVNPKELSFRRRDNTVEFFKDDKTFKTDLLGDFQQENASLAIETLKTLGISLPKENDLGSGLPGRMEKISEKPFILFDGGHNQEALDNILEYYNGAGDLYILFGQMLDKSLDLSKMKKKAKKIYYTKARYERSKDFQEEEFFFEDSEIAYKEVVKELKEEDTLFVIGSFYLIGEICEFLQEENFE